jgi:NADP-dependent 3-hydroxy acid dehydrogenase YdfG
LSGPSASRTIDHDIRLPSAISKPVPVERFVSLDLKTDGAYIITGGSGAVAAVVGKVFRAAGAGVALAGRNRDEVQERAASIGAVPLVADLTSLDEARHMVDEAQHALGGLDGLIHAAGGFEMVPAHLAEEGHFDRMFGVNMRTLFTATRAILPSLVARGRGFIAGFSTGAVWTGAGGPGMALYAASKAAVSTYLRSLEAEVRGHGIGVAIVYPIGSIDTERNRREMPDADRSAWIDPAEIATALLFACTRGPGGRLLELPIRAGR